MCRFPGFRTAATLWQQWEQLQEVKLSCAKERAAYEATVSDRFVYSEFSQDPFVHPKPGFLDHGCNRCRTPEVAVAPSGGLYQGHSSYAKIHLLLVCSRE